MINLNTFTANSYRAAQLLWRQYIVASRFVTFCTYLLAWVVATEVLYKMAVSGRTPRAELTASDITDAIVAFTINLEVDPTLELSILTMGCFGVVALPIVMSVFSSVQSIVVAETTIAQEHDRRHVAYAWTCATIGLLCVLSETLGVLEFESEDLLIGLGGVNMLVEEIRILEARHTKRNTQNG